MKLIEVDNKLKTRRISPCPWLSSLSVYRMSMSVRHGDGKLLSSEGLRRAFEVVDEFDAITHSEHTQNVFPLSQFFVGQWD